MQRRDAAARQGRPDRGGLRDGVRAQHQHRAPRRPQRPGQEGSARGGRLRVAAYGGAAFGRVSVETVVCAGVGVAVVHIGDHRSWRQRQRRPDDPGGHLAGVPPADGDRGLGDRPAQGRLVDPLVADPAGVGGRDGIRDHHHGQPVQGRMRDAVDRAGQSRPPGDDHGPGRPGQVGARGGHDHGSGLAVGQDEAQPRRVGGPNDVQVGTAARHAEHQPRSRLSQRPYDRIGARVGRDGAGAGGAGFHGAPLYTGHCVVPVVRRQGR